MRAWVAVVYCSPDRRSQVIMSAGMRDSLGNPIAVETYEYSPRAILAGRTIGMYTEYMVRQSYMRRRSLVCRIIS